MATETHRPVVTCPKKYKWAVNMIKLNVAYTHLTWKKENDPKFEITEEAVKAEYIELKGLLKEDEEKNLKIKRPRSTSNVD